MKRFIFIFSLLLFSIIGKAQKTTKHSIIVRDSIGSIISLNEEEYRNDSIVRTIHFIIDDGGRKVPSYKIEHSLLMNKNHADSVSTYYVYKEADGDYIQDKIVTFSFDIKKKKLISQTTQYVNKIDVVYPSIQVARYKYDRLGNVQKVKYSQKNGNKLSCNYIDKFSYENKSVNVKRFYFPSYNNKGQKVLIPKKECELYLSSILDDNNRVIYQKEERLSENICKISRYGYDFYGNLVKTDFYSQTRAGDLFLYSDSNEIKYESNRIKNIIHFRETTPGVNTLLFSEEYIYE